LISALIPEIHKKGVEVVSVPYPNAEVAMSGISGLAHYYQQYYPEFYRDNDELISSAIIVLQEIYRQTVFTDQKIDWTTHPNNLGHINSPGCFRCHDGKHLDSEQQAIRLECNLCHSIPIEASANDFTTEIEISRGPEPGSHFNPNWISLHNSSIDSTCSTCHTMENAGGVSNTSFCSNSVCHGQDYQYAGFNAPELRQILQPQIPTPPVALPTIPISGDLKFDPDIKAIFERECIACHNEITLTGGLDLSTYTGAMKGGKDGAVVVPGNSAESKLVLVQQAPHFRNLNASDLGAVIRWIDAGALEK
jgi:hypothetical protein